MINRSKTDQKLEDAIERSLDTLNTMDVTSVEFKNAAENLGKLYSMKGEVLTARIKPDTIALIAANLIGIAIILGYEQANVITSKALGFVFKGRV